MSTMSVRMPDSLHQRLREYAKQDNISINQFVTAAVTEKLAALSTVDYLQQRGALGSREAFDAVLAKVPDVPPRDDDR